MSQQLDDQKQLEICELLQKGCSRAVAARIVGCELDEIRREAERNPSFRDLIQQAESKHEKQHLDHINDAAKENKNWRAAVWMLERRYPARYGPRKPGTLTTGQVVELLDRFAATIVEEIPDVELRERIMHRLGEATHAIPRVEHATPTEISEESDEVES